ncbi:MAG TPA: hypothetical protein VFO66_12035 [Gemmatimonadaceae bacterium]|nr:hypothetical protein [Gemmatimonadaceae bacterium]
MTRRLSARCAAVAALVLVAACRDIPTPPGGVQAISRVLLPSPGLVVGDTMRDSLGVVAPLRVVAFDANGDTIAAPGVTFTLLDTTATLVNGDILIGRSTGVARLIATVAGLQTRLDTARVTLLPDTIVRADSVRHRRIVSGDRLLAGDTSFSSGDLTVIVQSRAGDGATGVDAVVVHYTITRAPASGPGGSGPTVVFIGGGATTARDTTASGGRAAKSIRLRIPGQPQLPDSAQVAATASYRGQTLGTVQFTIVFQTQ